MSEKTWFR